MADYDILVFGVTGFTGKLVCEYIFEKKYNSLLRWGVCGRSRAKVEMIVQEVAAGRKPLPAIEVADLACMPGSAEYEKLENIVKMAKVVITTAGPFEQYSQALVQICAQNGVHYADITGESDFFRDTIAKHDQTARKTGAKIVLHCGNDCIPYDMTVFEMNRKAKEMNAELTEVKTYSEFPPSTAASGGTLTTAVYQLSKKRGGKPAGGFDPLVTSPAGAASDWVTKIISPKKSVYVKEFGLKAGPWVMAPVMANCVRRSNALLGYSKQFAYSEALLSFPSLLANLQATLFMYFVGLALYVPFFRRFLTQPGEGPRQEDMEKGWLKLHGRGVIKDKEGNESLLKSTYYFNQDTGYLQTAHMLVESGMLLLDAKGAGGVLTPAVAFGERMVPRLEEMLGADFTIKQG